MNASSDFEQCHAVTEKWEGGWSNHPSDRGGKTMYGVTEAVFHAWLRKHKKPIRPVKSITISEARSLYYDEYWLAGKCDTLAKGVDLAVYDSNVNSGVSRGRSWLMASIGGTDVETIKNICAKRLSFMRGLSNWAVFGKGWLNRVTDIEAKSVARNLKSSPKTSQSVKDALKAESASAGKSSAINQKGAVGTGTTTGTGYLLTPEEADALLSWLFTAGILALGIALAYFCFKTIVHKRRSEAYSRAAAEVKP